MNSQNEQAYKNFLVDIVSEILEKADEAKEVESSEFQKGYSYALYEIISLLIQQSESFNLNKEELGLNHIDPESDYL
ncbi:hypothetical protein [Acinetobacter vivianii]|uniref:hypothetical protein n=1 Tax=Acinetobacter vivianii TaxID=1776742 RepID=UPI002DBA0311|nr:hypothetical protein [Acinetobacter vivianii]MEB6478671.1 hypothetical protein [Acinetobacter vivianii]MEB6657498.1 hypothetical protein [Acinetobacter vivianii]